MRKTTAKNNRFSIDRVTIGQLGCEIARRTVKIRDRCARYDRDTGLILDTLDHAADRVLRPLARRYELGVPGQNRRAAKPVLFLDNDTLFANRGKTVSCGQTGRPATNY